MFGLSLFLEQLGSQKHQIFVVSGSRFRLIPSYLLLLFVLGDAISPSLQHFSLVLCHSCLCSHQTSLILSVHFLQIQTNILFLLSVLIIFVVHLRFKSGEFFDKVGISGQYVLIAIACILCLSGEPIFVAEYLLQYYKS